eukprot:Colp12_sorted_trinity150504_noHs@6455
MELHSSDVLEAAAALTLLQPTIMANRAKSEAEQQDPFESMESTADNGTQAKLEGEVPLTEKVLVEETEKNNEDASIAPVANAAAEDTISNKESAPEPESPNRDVTNEQTLTVQSSTVKKKRQRRKKIETEQQDKEKVEQIEALQNDEKVDVSKIVS